jgi:hypothetical protein
MSKAELVGDEFACENSVKGCSTVVSPIGERFGAAFTTDGILNRLTRAGSMVTRYGNV